jgi:hypothetical protein
MPNGVVVKTCTVTDGECSNDGRYYASGYCRRHYSRWRRWGDPTVVKAVFQDRPLPVCKTCGNPARSYQQDLCDTHYQMQWKYGRDVPVQAGKGSRKGATCECGEPVLARGLCARHYADRREQTLPNCSAPDCSARARAKGLCATHRDNGADYNKQHRANSATHLYLMARPGEMQIGETRCPVVRIRQHERQGWVLVDIIELGTDTQRAETELRRWLRANVGTLPGRLENWSTADLEVASLAELSQVSGVSL